jgi:hypothetical protein
LFLNDFMLKISLSTNDKLMKKMSSGVPRPGFETSGWAYLIKPTLIGSHLGWGTITVAGDEPSFVVVPGELDERGSQLFDGIEGSHPQQVLLEGSDEALCDAVALGLSHE